MEFVAALGTVQGALLLLLILFRYRNTKNLPLVLLLLTFSLRLGTTPSWNPETLLAHQWFLPLTGGVPLLFGPLVWWYVRELKCDSPAAPRFLPLHFLPFAVETVLLVAIVSSMTAVEYQGFVRELFSSRPPAWMTVRNVLKIVSGVIYAAAAVRIAIRRPDVPATAGSNRRLWITAIVAAPLFSLVCFGVAAFWPDAARQVAGDGWSIFLVPAGAMALTLYMFSMLVILEPKSLSYGVAQTTSAQSQQLCVSPADRARLLERIQEQLDSDAILDSSFSLRELSERPGRHPNRISYVINREFGCSFPRLINSLRTDYFVRRVSEGALAQQSILELAFEAGFSSKSTFNRVFKERVGVAPSDYVHLVDAQSEAQV
jgi:AraC-like DNA-binding protein